jgi:alpha-amylase
LNLILNRQADTAQAKYLVNTSHQSLQGIFRRAAILIAILLSWCVPYALAEDVSAPATLQIFEAKWNTIDERMVDIFETGYGRLWLPPPSRADSGDGSVGYDVYDRFDLGRPRKETLYGTEQGLKILIRTAHASSIDVYTDQIFNHAGFSDLGTVDTKGTATTADDVSFAQAGGYPGLAITLPGDIDGDFHGSFEGGDLNGRLAGLVDIAQEKSHMFFRNPVQAGNPSNIPAGTAAAFGRQANLPNANNARFYPDQALGGMQLDVDPGPGEFLITRHNFNTTNPLSGDAVLETAEQMTLRHALWMIQEIGVDGFRIDAAKHFPTNTLTLLDQTVFKASNRMNHDGTYKPVFSFSEVLDGNKGFVQNYIRHDLANPVAINSSDFTVRGNRDALDFPLFYAMRDNLTGNGLANNWHQIRNASQDMQDDGLRNGSQGVSFVDSHDNLGGGFPFLKNVAYAYTLMRPGNAVVYLNAKEFGEGRDFPNDGKDDALGGFYGSTITKLVEIRNTHGRGDFHERWVDDAFNPNGFSNIYIYERENSAVVGLNSRNDSFVETRNGVQTGFASGTILVELTGNAADPTVDPGNVIPQTVKVNGSGQINMSIPSNGTHGRGYVIYGLPTPQGSLSLSNVASTLQGATATAANNGTARLADIQVIRANTFQVQLNTTPVSVFDPDSQTMVRDFSADGDTALLKINDGMDLNNVSGIDNPTPGGVAYGFENFTDTRIPGYTNNGIGTYSQTIDTTELSEGRHYVTVRAFRQRNSGPAVFTDFKQAIYVDRLAPEVAIQSFAPYESSPSTLQNRDLIVKSLDGTADNMHIFLDLAANLTDAQVLQMALNGQGDASAYDMDSFVFGFNNVATGIHVATVVTFEPTYDGTHGYSVRRLPGLFTQTGVGAGFGDLNTNGVLQTIDIAGLGNGSFETVLYSQNSQFRATADLDGNGRIDNLDLFALGPSLVSSGAGVGVLAAYDGVLARRGDINQDTATNVTDVSALYSAFGGSAWRPDLNVDGVVDVDDVQTLITNIVGTVNGDFDLDGDVDGRDFLTWQRNVGLVSGVRYDRGDADLNGVINGDDLTIWQAAYGNPGLTASTAVSVAVPEPHSVTLLIMVATALTCRPFMRCESKLLQLRTFHLRA